MKFHVTVSTIAFSAALLGACSNDSDATTPLEVATAPDTVEITVPNAADATVVAGERLSQDAPAFASLYPQATLSKPVVTARENGNEGGIAEFTTADSPQLVMDHYRQLASSNGLLPVMAMNQGTARAFAAKNQDGAELQVVASPSEDGLTSVQLTWQAAG